MRTYKSFWQGSSWVISIPSQICQSLKLKEKDVLLLKADPERRILTLANPPEDCKTTKRPKKIDDNTYIVPVRVIGAEGVAGKYPYSQLGFTIPREVSEKFANVEFEVVLEERTANSFKIVYRPAETIKAQH